MTKEEFAHLPVILRLRSLALSLSLRARKRRGPKNALPPYKVILDAVLRRRDFWLAEYRQIGLTNFVKDWHNVYMLQESCVMLVQGVEENTQGKPSATLEMQDTGGNSMFCCIENRLFIDFMSHISQHKHTLSLSDSFAISAKEILLFLRDHKTSSSHGVRPFPVSKESDPTFRAFYDVRQSLDVDANGFFIRPCLHDNFTDKTFSKYLFDTFERALGQRIAIRHVFAKGSMLMWCQPLQICVRGPSCANECYDVVLPPGVCFGVPSCTTKGYEVVLPLELCFGVLLCAKEGYELVLHPHTVFSNAVTRCINWTICGPHFHRLSRRQP